MCVYIFVKCVMVILSIELKDYYFPSVDPESLHPAIAASSATLECKCIQFGVICM